MKNNLCLTAAAMAAGLLVGCASGPTQPNAALEEARQLYGRTSTSPAVASTAQVELERARAALARADASWTGEGDTAETNHLAYLAKQLTVVAAEAGAQREAETRVQQASAERERIRADARTTEARAAQAQAASAQANAAAAQQQAQSASQRASQLEQELQQMAARATERGMVLTLQDVLFDVGQATLKPGAERTLERVAELLRHFPERRLLIEGFTDSTGSEGANLELSRRRAEAVQQALVTRGVGRDRIDVAPHGEAYPVANNETPSGRQMNRRVELLFSNEQGQLSEQR
ncbi:OmpA family protein [Caldimonas brevitalea]|uniref:Major porin and structural outer membrane porin n=1 Tax=Caldimonas brevitalea TaxID=413882 RepID=A0A0G3BRH4_9BURK|nr:OmpA family protein [Caldimonas brevitalea]AKJ30583.1 major porin and structural outer membrane porin [Caldimonas brevitalea]